MADQDSAVTAILIADIPGLQALRTSDDAVARKLLGKMQQVVSEAAYLFDGYVIDLFAEQIVATLPDPAGAVRALLKIRSDVREYNTARPPEEPPLAFRLVGHAGDYVVDGSTVSGAAYSEATGALASMHAFEVGATTVLCAAVTAYDVKTKPLGHYAGLDVVEVSALEAPKLPPPPPVVVPEQKEVAPGKTAGRGPRRLVVAAIVALVLIVLGAAVAVMLVRRDGKSSVVADAPVAPIAAAPVEHVALLIEPFDVESAAEDAGTKASAIRYAFSALLRAYSQVEIVEDAAKAEYTISAVVRDGGAGPEIAPRMKGKRQAEGPPQFLANPQVAAGELLKWTLKSVGLNGTAVDSIDREAFASFMQASIENASDAPDSSKRAAAALQDAVARDPGFVAAYVLSFEMSSRAGDTPAALASARRISELDPSNVRIQRTVASLSLATGDPATGIAALRRILEKKPNDADALRLIAKQALSVGDGELFKKAVVKIGDPAASQVVHEPDYLVALGRLDPAVDLYYDLEYAAQTNAALAEKIGRVAVLRRSIEIAKLELTKLQKLRRPYGENVIQAFLAAQQGDVAKAEEALAAALASAGALDDPHTAAAETYAMLGNAGKTLDELELAVNASEPTMTYIENNPLFEYVASDKRYAIISNRMKERKAAMRAELARLRF